MFCNECGKEIKEKAVVCVNCGVAVNRSRPRVANEKKMFIAILLNLLPFFVGLSGIHRFYTGHIGIGVIQLLTLGGCGVWQLIDFIIILSGSYRDSDGNLLGK